MLMPKNAPPGWVVLTDKPAAMWHYRDETTYLYCRNKPEPNVAEWRPEPSGRREVCPLCRKRHHSEQLKADREARQVRKLTSPDPRAADMPEPEVLALPEPVPPKTPEPVPAAPAVIAPNPQDQTPVKTPTKPVPAKAVPVTNSAFMTVPALAEEKGWAPTNLVRFLNEHMPDCPRLGTGAKAPYVIDPTMKARIVTTYEAFLKGETIKPPKGQDAAMALMHAKLDRVIALLDTLVSELGVKP